MHKRELAYTALRSVGEHWDSEDISGMFIGKVHRGRSGFDVRCHPLQYGQRYACNPVVPYAAHDAIAASASLLQQYRFFDSQAFLRKAASCSSARLCLRPASRANASSTPESKLSSDALNSANRFALAEPFLLPIRHLPLTPCFIVPDPHHYRQSDNPLSLQASTTLACVFK